MELNGMLFFTLSTDLIRTAHQKLTPKIGILNTKLCQSKNYVSLMLFKQSKNLELMLKINTKSVKNCKAAIFNYLN